MRRSILPLVLVPLVSVSAAAAQDCDRKDETQSGMTICASADFAASDRQLNATYGEIMKRLADDQAGRKRLQAAQRAWVSFRDAECEFQTAMTIGGSIHPMLVAQCRTELTDGRTKQLDAYLACAEGDMTCPVPAP
jgi:uncharacterized protein YecT (DUF1311 family)